MCNGFRLVGDLDPSGQFPSQFKPAALDVEQLKQTAKWAQKAVVSSCRKVAEDPEIAAAVWEETIEQTLPGKQWVRGPFTADEISARQGEDWIPPGASVCVSQEKLGLWMTFHSISSTPRSRPTRRLISKALIAFAPLLVSFLVQRLLQNKVLGSSR